MVSIVGADFLLGFSLDKPFFRATALLLELFVGKPILGFLAREVLVGTPAQIIFASGVALLLVLFLGESCFSVVAFGARVGAVALLISSTMAALLLELFLNGMATQDICLRISLIALYRNCLLVTMPLEVSCRSLNFFVREDRVEAAAGMIVGVASGAEVVVEQASGSGAGAVLGEAGPSELAREERWLEGVELKVSHRAGAYERVWCKCPLHRDCRAQRKFSKRFARESGLGMDEPFCFLGVWLRDRGQFETAGEHEAYRKELAEDYGKSRSYGRDVLGLCVD